MNYEYTMSIGYVHNIIQPWKSVINVSLLQNRSQNTEQRMYSIHLQPK